MPRPPASSYRLGDQTDDRIRDLSAHLGLTASEVIRQAVRRLHRAEIGRESGRKKIQKKSRTGIDNGNTTV